MSFPYKKVLIIGATSGIGKSLATKLVQNGTRVVVAGRRKENLEEFVAQHGSEMVDSAVFDVMQLEKIPEFASTITSAHPDLDCVFINSGIQRPFDFARPETVDLDIFDQELITNYTSAVRLTKAFLPHLQQLPQRTALVYTTSQMALVPMMRCPNYGASKAALHHFILALRTQLRDGKGNVQVLEIYPPAVQTELHDAKHQPDLKDGHLIGMPLQEFVDEVYARLVGGEDQIPVGSAQEIFEAFEVKRQTLYQGMTEMLAGMLKQFLRE
ncbi:putative short-chain dehydrogenase/oxidoreductase [Aspergillus saccharolyticus JOP 1030-1]|uniref:Putative short-chain dehydrogenase/oxidoreductase n=1 Tax=Aspergillus saccharolyticus JOP 1030-1 TaxID=1450539 RepID=A0A318ZD44_9EURO|nr:putative short-chain dehydrogenase/oxidoreductase [Aspergillus saccharolyticus JOP 1030-1]PYH42573.1 putative short-chain dehydrogenase/oxidoreductase [Aspergillus saccharolyticus JOP 1030-1]